VTVLTQRPDDQAAVDWARARTGEIREATVTERKDKIFFMTDYILLNQNKKGARKDAFLKLEKNLLFVESGNSKVSQQIDIKDNINQFHNSKGGKNDGQANKSIGDLIAGSGNGFFITFGHNPSKTTPDEHEEENQGDDDHNQANSAGNNAANGEIAQIGPLTRSTKVNGTVISESRDSQSGVNGGSNGGIFDEIFEFLNHIYSKFQ